MKLNEFPKAEQKFQEFCKKNLEAFQANIMKDAPMEGIDLPELTPEMIKQYTESLLVTQPRILYDFFDENEVFILADMYQGEFKMRIFSILGDYKGKGYEERVEAEQDVFQEAFKILEEKA